MLGDELRESARTGATRLTNAVRDADYGSLLSRAKAAYGFLSRHVKNIAFLDPLGFGSQEKLKVPFMMTQVIDRNQRCEFLPETNRALCQYEGQLIVNGRALPMVRLQGAAGDAVTMGNKHLYAINTNQHPDAFKLLGLSQRKYKNIRLVVACNGSIVLPPPEGKDLRLMRVIKNAELTPETRRIKRETTGNTLWIPTVLIAVPFNLCAGLINVGLMIPHVLVHGIKRLTNAAAEKLESKVQHIKVAQERGTVRDPGLYRPWLLFAGACRLVERPFALLSCALGTLRAWSTCLLKSVPLLTDALCNMSSAQLTVAKCYVGNTATRVDSMFANFCEESKAVGRFYSGTVGKMDTAAQEEKAKKKFSQNEGVSSFHAMNQADGEKLSPLFRRSQQGGLSSTKWRSRVAGCGQNLSDLGVCVSYGTAQQGVENFADNVKKQKRGGNFVGRS